MANIAVFGHELRVGAITWARFEKFFLLFSVVWYVGASRVLRSSTTRVGRVGMRAAAPCFLLLGWGAQGGACAAGDQPG